ncbi:hypothetical protein [Devosia sediminis]|uniref:Uncharacterized protein n=1 Tax=Devosia sediminis TaxID=2798801 RepID=A0A934MKR6_9HYPH|nr:hypothetical protein [Devosia sediminis]MBJ3783856.1 hypothetical protein [Devosia sediminis]
MLEYFTAAKTLIDCFGAVKEHAKRGQSGTRQDFDQLVTPIYDALPPLIDNYLLIFTTAKKAIRAAQTFQDVVVASEILRDQRAKFLATRIRVRGEADALYYIVKDPEIRRFMYAVARIFDAPFYGVSRSGERKMSASAYVEGMFSDLEHLRPVAENWNDSRQQIDASIVAAQNFLELNWAKVVQEYSAMKGGHLVKSERLN